MRRRREMGDGVAKSPCHTTRPDGRSAASRRGPREHLPLEQSDSPPSMTHNVTPQSEPFTSEPAVFPPTLAAQQIAQIGTLLEELDKPLPRPPATAAPVLDPQIDNQLVQVRLGIAAQLVRRDEMPLFATASSHCLRVALTCSTWSWRMGLPTAARDAIEVAALLHDVGMVSLPDQILHKPGPLDAEEKRLVEQSRRHVGRDSRRRMRRVVDPRHRGDTWRRGTTARGAASAPRANEIPFGARMIAIVEAFDSMTTDHVFRRPITQERAIRELFALCRPAIRPGPGARLRGILRDATRGTSPRASPGGGSHARSRGGQLVLGAGARRRAPPRDRPSALLRDAAAGQHARRRRVHRRRACRSPSGTTARSGSPGITASSICPTALVARAAATCRTRKGDAMAEADCPVAGAIHSGTQSLRRLTIAGRSGRPVAVDCHAIPVHAADDTSLGAVAPAARRLVGNLAGAAMPEPARKGHARSAHPGGQPRGVRPRAGDVRQRPPAAAGPVQPDHLRPGPFQAGQRHLRPPGRRRGDQVAWPRLLRAFLPAGRSRGPLRRRGIRDALRRLQQRQRRRPPRRTGAHALGRSRHAAARGRRVTASFGVTEIQPGDTPDTMLRRADRALLMAKAAGRNRVVQLGVGFDDEPTRGGPGEGRLRRSSCDASCSRPCRWPWRSRNCAASWPITGRGSSTSRTRACIWRSPTRRPAGAVARPIGRPRSSCGWTCLTNRSPRRSASAAGLGDAQAVPAAAQPASASRSPPMHPRSPPADVADRRNTCSEPPIVPDGRRRRPAANRGVPPADREGDCALAAESNE